jgi:4-hydroxy-tetrahydrodipicolinate reductase
MLLAKTIAEYSKKPFPEVLQYGRKGTNLKREKEIAIHSLRGGSVVGDHEVFFLGQNENLVLSHNALNRKIFVHGALSAVEWISQKQNGLFGMKEVLGF